MSVDLEEWERHAAQAFADWVERTGKKRRLR